MIRIGRGVKGHSRMEEVMDIKRIRYTRTSHGNENPQAASHERQHLNLDREYGTIEERWTWQDDHPGTSFDRPGFQDLIAFCEADPRPQDDPGFIEMDSPCRFGRLLDGNGDMEVATYMSILLRLDRVGWRLRFVSDSLIGGCIADCVPPTPQAFDLYQRICEAYGKSAVRGVAAALEGWKGEA